MALRIMIDVFSGRPNPVVELEEKEAQEMLARLRPADALAENEAATTALPILGYRGLIVEQTGKAAKGLPKAFRVSEGKLLGANLAHRATDAGLEEFILANPERITGEGLKRDFVKNLRREIDRAREIRAELKLKDILWPKKTTCPCAPLYEPSWWNDGGGRQYNNNCYNYSTNYRTDTFAQPGRAAGSIYTSLTCASVRPAAEKDMLINAPTADNKCPEEGHLVALVIAPGWDFHWYRKGRNGYWSHKPGSTQVTNLDNSGKLISDPRTANRGPYTDFCTFMVVMHGHIKIN